MGLRRTGGVVRVVSRFRGMEGRHWRRMSISLRVMLGVGLEARSG